MHRSILSASNPQNVIQWGQRVYFYNSHKESGDLAWHKDNLQTAEGAPTPAQITTGWTFAGKWNPSDKPTMIDQATKRSSGNQITTRSAESNNTAADKTDPIAENMLVYQRAVGGWPKALNEVKVDYTKQLSEAEKTAIRNDSLHKDATIDNAATMREIRYLSKAFRNTNNRAYLAAAEKGVRFYLKAQYANGGWPQYYPDSALYRSQITYNDDAMMNVMNVLQDIAESKNDLDVIDRSLLPAINAAVERGVQCILKTQIVADGKLTAWCAQYNRKTLQPEMARKFELVSLSGSESVGITRFLMRIKNPSPEIKKSITSAIAWFDLVKIAGYKYTDIVAPSEPKGKDRVILPDPTSTIWARFYEIGTNRPFFTGRDSIKKYDVKEIEHERRNGYAWYGNWPEKLLKTEYPAWAKNNMN
jgi:PelA/Pel-15E family pectate lyase